MLIPGSSSPSGLSLPKEKPSNRPWRDVGRVTKGHKEIWPPTKYQLEQLGKQHKKNKVASEGKHSNKHNIYYDNNNGNGNDGDNDNNNASGRFVESVSMTELHKQERKLLLQQQSQDDMLNESMLQYHPSVEHTATRISP